MLTVKELKAARERWFLTQGDVAAAAGCTKQFVSAVEKGDERLTAKLSAAYKKAIGRKRRELRRLTAERRP